VKSPVTQIIFNFNLAEWLTDHQSGCWSIPLMIDPLLARLHGLARIRRVPKYKHPPLSRSNPIPSSNLNPSIQEFIPFQTSRSLGFQAAIKRLAYISSPSIPGTGIDKSILQARTYVSLSHRNKNYFSRRWHFGKRHVYFLLLIMK